MNIFSTKFLAINPHVVLLFKKRSDAVEKRFATANLGEPTTASSKTVILMTNDNQK